MARAALLSIAVILCAAPPSIARAAAPASRNVVLIVVDDVGTDLLGAYGEVKAGLAPPPEHFVTPNLDAMAERGVVFENAWSGPLCSTTRATILTGQYAFRNGLGAVGSLDRPEYSPTPYLSLAAHLASPPGRARRSMIGKWHVTDFTAVCRTYPPSRPYLPSQAGYTQYQGFPGSGSSQFGWCERVESAGGEPCDGASEDASGWPPLCRGRERYETSAEVDRAVRFLDEAPPEPWFLQLGFHSLHDPLEAPPESLHAQAWIHATYAEGEEALDADARTMRRAMLQALDTELGRFFDRLERYDCGSPGCHLARTTVILVGDNGTDGALPTAVNRDDKGSLYEGGVNVPLLVMGDAVTPLRRGRKTRALVHTVDLYATIAEMTGRGAPVGVTLDSMSFASHLAGASAAPRQCVYTDGVFQATSAERDRHDSAVRNATHKLIRRPNPGPGASPYELYTVNASGHLDETAPLPIPTGPSDPSWAVFRELSAQVNGSVSSPCKPGTSCGLGPELALLLPLLRRRYST